MSTTPTALTTFEQIMADWRAMCEENRRLTATVQEQGRIIDRLDAKLADACLGKEELTAMLDEVRERNQELVIENQRMKESRERLRRAVQVGLCALGELDEMSEYENMEDHLYDGDLDEPEAK